MNNITTHFNEHFNFKFKNQMSVEYFMFESNCFFSFEINKQKIIIYMKNHF